MQVTIFAGELWPDKYKFPRGCTVLVTGASGFAGTVLTRKLCNLGVNVRALVRNQSSIRLFQKMGIDWVVGDVADPKAVAKAVEGVQFIFHVAAVRRNDKVPVDEYHKVHIQSTKYLAQAAAKQNNFVRYIQVSAIPPQCDRSIKDVFAQTKIEAERWLKIFGETSGLPWTIIRPVTIYGPGDSKLLHLFRLARLPVVPLLKGGYNMRHLIHVEDFSECMILAALHPKALGQLYICGNPKPLSVAEIIRTIASESGRKPLTLSFPSVGLSGTARMVEMFFEMMRLPSPVFSSRIDFFTKNMCFDTSKLYKELGFECRVGPREGLMETARWYRNRGII